ncbi:hypothetical protein B7463_g11554, partial [Scytalidium lignicola]
MVPVPEPGPDEVLLRLNTTGLCFTDLHYMMHDFAFPKMSDFGVRSPGHEGAGVIVKVGANVKNWKVGDRGGVKPVWDVYGSCDLCWGNKEAYCANAISTGLVKTGTYQQYIVSPAKYTTRIPDGVDDFIAAPAMCSAATMYRSLIEAELRPGDWVCFPGGGGGESLPINREDFIDFKETKHVAAAVVAIADNVGAHAVLVTAPQAYSTAITAMNTVTIGADPSLFAFRNLEIKGTLVGSMEDTSRALDFAGRGLLKPIYETYPIDKLPEAVQKLKKGEVAGRCVVDFNA